MALGFRTHLSNGGIQIDQTYRNLAMRAKGSFSPGTAWNNNKWRFGQITVTGNTPVLAWRCNSPCAMVYATRAGASITYTFIVAATTGTVEWWLFDDPAFGVATGPHGIRIRNPSNGVVVYDSRMKYMRVVGTLNGDFGALVAPNNGSYAGGSTAVITGNAAYQYISNLVSQAGSPPFPWTDFVFYPMATVSGGDVVWTVQQSDPVTHPASQAFQNGTQQNAYSFLFVDVSNF
jgi:hypothetical protein